MKGPFFHDSHPHTPHPGYGALSSLHISLRGSCHVLLLWIQKYECIFDILYQYRKFKSLKDLNHFVSSFRDSSIMNSLIPKEHWLLRTHILSSYIIVTMVFTPLGVANECNDLKIEVRTSETPQLYCRKCEGRFGADGQTHFSSSLFFCRIYF